MTTTQQRIINVAASQFLMGFAPSDALEYARGKVPHAPAAFGLAAKLWPAAVKRLAKVWLSKIDTERLTVQ